MSADVMRVGNLDCTSTVSLVAKDDTAKAGVNFAPTSGKLVFAPGENEKETRVPVIKSLTWGHTIEFELLLQHDPAPDRCVLGKYLWRARVKVIHAGFFPSDAFEDALRGNATADKPVNLDSPYFISRTKLLKEYIKWSMVTTPS